MFTRIGRPSYMAPLSCEMALDATVNAFDAEGMNAPDEIRRLCVKVANQAGKGHLWTAMAAATELVAACQRGCRAEVERVGARARVTAFKGGTRVVSNLTS